MASRSRWEAFLLPAPKWTAVRVDGIIFLPVMVKQYHGP
jgi:hypothetical protein